MTKPGYDTRSRAQILAAPHFAAFRDGTGIDQVGLRELRTLDRFYSFAGARGISVPAVQDFLAFVEDDRSPRRLDDLRTAFDRFLPSQAPVRQTVRDAIRAKRPRSRTCDRRTRHELRDLAAMAPYRDLATFEQVATEDLRVLARFLVFTEGRGITVPSVEDYLAFSADLASSRRLRSLKAALVLLLPGNPAVHVVLTAAIARKSPSRKSKAGRNPRPEAARRVPLSALPVAWQNLLRKMRMGAMPMHKAHLSESVLDSMEDTLREYARVQSDAGEAVDITIEGIRRLEASRADHADKREHPQYADQGNRPATRHTAIMRLRQFADALELDPALRTNIKVHENILRRDLASVVPLKFGRLDALPTLADTWSLAAHLLYTSAEAPRRQTALRLLNEAAIVALWTLLPLRLRDGQLVWGRDITFDGTYYRVDIDTMKEHEPLQGRLHGVLTPFLDALVLRGVDPVYLEEMRHRAIASEAPLFCAVNGRMLARGYPSKVWWAHFGTGAHISRSRIHSELGQLGPEGVEAALALNAQRDPRTAAFYQSEAIAVALRRKGQDMVDGLLEECRVA